MQVGSAAVYIGFATRSPMSRKASTPSWPPPSDRPSISRIASTPARPGGKSPTSSAHAGPSWPNSWMAAKMTCCRVLRPCRGRQLPLASPRAERHRIQSSDPQYDACCAAALPMKPAQTASYIPTRRTRLSPNWRNMWSSSSRTRAMERRRSTWL